MKYSRSLIFVFYLFIGSFSSLSGQNALINSGFEDGLEPWVAGSWGGPSADFSVTEEEAWAGQRSMKVAVASTDQEAAKVFLRQQGLALDPSREYTASFRVLSHSGKAESINLQLYSHENIGSTGWGIAFAENEISFEGDGEWHAFSFTFRPLAVSGAPDFNSLGFMFGFARQASTYFVDEVLLAENDVAAPEEFNVYHVSKQGSDDNPGTRESPFLTIAKAASVAQAGDTCFIHSGTYEETLRPLNSGQEGFPIVFQAARNEKVVITAMQALDNWTTDEGQVYKTVVDWDLGQENFVMNGSTACDLARWPNNMDGDPFTLNSKRNTGGSGEDVAFNAFLTHSEIPDLDWSKGGSILFYGDRPGSGWTTWKAFIKSSVPGRVTFDLDKNPAWIRTAHPPADRGDYYLEGIRAALDFENEWFFDPETKTLYLQLPGGQAPVDGEVKMRRRKLTVDLNGRSHIQVNNLAVFGGGIEISGSGNKLFGISSFYGNYTRGVVSGFNAESRSVYIKSGANNLIERCEIAFGAGTGIWDSGVGTQILNSYLHDFNFIGDYDAVIMARGGSGTVIRNNVIARAGRDALQIVNKGSEVAYNDFYQSNLIADDCGLLYTLGPGLNMNIHHNWFHDIASRGSLSKATAVYLDNDAGNVSVHHNAIWNTEWSNIQINWNGTNIDVFNNTMWNGSAAMGAWHKAGTAFSNVRVWNNLTNKNSLEPQSDKQNNLIMTTGSDPFTNLAAGNFTLRPGVEAIDFGRIIDGITDGFAGAAPDAGAYESGGTIWTPGIDWAPRSGPAGLGCYGLPGENCENVTGVRSMGFKPVQVYPNPVGGDRLTVQLEQQHSAAAVWHIYALNGMQMASGKADLFRQLQLDVGSLGPGVYILQIKTQHAGYTAKIIRQ